MAKQFITTIDKIVLYQNEEGDRFRGWEAQSSLYHVRLLDVDRGEEWETIVSHAPGWFGKSDPAPQPGQKCYFCPADCGWLETTQVLEVFHVIG